MTPVVLYLISTITRSKNQTQVSLYWDLVVTEPWKIYLYLLVVICVKKKTGSRVIYVGIRDLSSKILALRPYCSFVELCPENSQQ